MADATTKAVISPFVDTGAWDTMWLYRGEKGYQIPGGVMVEVSGSVNDDRKKIDGKDGEDVTVLSFTPKTVKVVIRVWTSDQFYALQTLLRVFQPSNTKERVQAIVCIHPKVQMHKITSVYITSISDPPTTAVDGYTINMEMREWIDGALSAQEFLDLKLASGGTLAPSGDLSDLQVAGTETTSNPSTPTPVVVANNLPSSTVTQKVAP
jgi:hypothetical protein